MQVHELYNIVHPVSQIVLIDAWDMNTVIAEGEDCLYYGHNLIRSVEAKDNEIFVYVHTDHTRDGINASTSVKASSDITYPWVTVEFHGEIKAYGNLKDASLIKNIMEAMRRDDAFAKAMSDFYNPEYTTMEWDYSIYEEIALGIVDFCKDQYREWQSLTERGREDNPFIIISEDESIVIS